jgi:hypothetical protein
MSMLTYTVHTIDNYFSITSLFDVYALHHCHVRVTVRQPVEWFI